MSTKSKVLFSVNSSVDAEGKVCSSIQSCAFDELVPGTTYLITPMGGELDDGHPIPAEFCECLGDVRSSLRSLLNEEALKYDDETLKSGMTLWAVVFVVMGDYATAFRAYLPIVIEPDPEEPELEVLPKDYVDSVADISVDEAMVFAVREIREMPDV